MRQHQPSKGQIHLRLYPRVVIAPERGHNHHAKASSGSASVVVIAPRGIATSGGGGCGADAPRRHHPGRGHNTRNRSQRRSSSPPGRPGRGRHSTGTRTTARPSRVVITPEGSQLSAALRGGVRIRQAVIILGGVATPTSVLRRPGRDRSSSSRKGSQSQVQAEKLVLAGLQAHHPREGRNDRCSAIPKASIPDVVIPREGSQHRGERQRHLHRRGRHHPGRVSTRRPATAPRCTCTCDHPERIITRSTHSSARRRSDVVSLSPGEELQPLGAAVATGDQLRHHHPEGVTTRALPTSTCR